MLFAALGVVLGFRAMSACSSFGEAEPVDGPDATTADGPVGPVDASDAGVLPDVHVSYCKTLGAAQICNEFPGPPVISGWAQFGNADAGVAEWTEAGATDPGAALFSVDAVPAPTTGQPSRVYLSRGVPQTPPTPSRLRYEMSVYFDTLPDVGYLSVVRLFTGKAIFYITYSQLGYTFNRGYYGSVCGGASTPCLGGDLQGTKPPIAKNTWDRLSITIAKKVADDMTYEIVFEASSGERIVTQAPPGFEPKIDVNAYLDVGFVILSPAPTGRRVMVDDVSLTVQ